MAGGGTEFDGTTSGESALISSDINLEAGKEYKLDFIWNASKAAMIENECCSFEVRVRKSGTDSWTTVFDATNSNDVEASGISYPWGQWADNQSVVDISDFAGQTINIAFVWVKKQFERMYSNWIRIDEIKVEEYSRITTPVIECATKQYVFPSTWVGGTSNSEAITIKNVGVGTLTINKISGLDGSDFECRLNPATVALKKNESTSFNVRYTPTLTGSPTATMTIEINDGGQPYSIDLKGSKKIMPDGYSYQGFESANFPPVGWSKVGNWRALNSSFSGDWCAYVNLTQEDAHELISPRLDLSGDQNYTLSFTYYDQWDQTTDDSYEPENYVTVYLSKDGGETWEDAIFTNDVYNEQKSVELDLGSPASDNCYVKWVYYIPDFDPTVYDYEYTTFFLDDVVLPPLYGAGAAPKATSAADPADEAVDVANNSLVLSWNEAQFADGYKVSLGTSATDFNLINSQEVAGTSIDAPRLEYATKYYWKVVPYNAYGEAEDVAVWSFTTMADQSISTFPYSEGFESRDDQLPLGWNVNAQGTASWKISKIGVYDGKQIAFAQGTTSDSEATLISPEIVLPADDEMIVSFFWGNNPPATLSKDVTGAAVNTTTEPDGIEAGYFQINDGTGWKDLVLISEDSQYWVREAVSLKDYAGKIVQLRWHYVLTNGYKRRGLSLDNITIKSSKDSSLQYYNVQEWAAGDVNNGSSWDSADKIYVINGSTESATVKSVSFTTDNFSANLAAGATINANSAKAVLVTYNAGTIAQTISDEMSIEFTNGSLIKLPVSATTLAADIRYFSFEGDEFGSTTPNGLTTIDVDGQATVMSSVIRWPHRGEAFAYIVIDVSSDKADWRNVYPHSGEKVLAAFRTQTENIDAEDWIVSPCLKATAQSKFRFFGKSYATTDDYNDFTPHYFEVWVSTTEPTVAGMTERAKSTTELAYKENQDFTEYSIDLSKWAGKDIYVGLKHTTTISGYVAFFDDFYYEHFNDASGIDDITADDATTVQFYNLQGVAVPQDNLTPGLYIRRSGNSAQKVIIK
jgi:hypothetical protein